MLDLIPQLERLSEETIRFLDKLKQHGRDIPNYEQRVVKRVRLESLLEGGVRFASSNVKILK